MLNCATTSIYIFESGGGRGYYYYTYTQDLRGFFPAVNKLCVKIIITFEKSEGYISIIYALLCCV